MVNSFKQSMSREIVLEEMNCEENTESVSDDYNVVDYEEVDSNSLADTEKSTKLFLITMMMTIYLTCLVLHIIFNLLLKIVLSLKYLKN